MRKLLLFGMFVALCTTVQSQNLQKGDYGYLYCHMSGRGEWTAYALSRDGLNFEDLIGGEPVYDVEELSQSKAVRAMRIYAAHTTARDISWSLPT